MSEGVGSEHTRCTAALHFHEQIARFDISRLAVIGNGGAQGLGPRPELLVKFVPVLDVGKNLVGFVHTGLQSKHHNSVCGWLAECRV